jgi:hypothetical protein
MLEVEMLSGPTRGRPAPGTNQPCGPSAQGHSAHLRGRRSAPWLAHDGDRSTITESPARFLSCCTPRPPTRQLLSKADRALAEDRGVRPGIEEVAPVSSLTMMVSAADRERPGTRVAEA